MRDHLIPKVRDFGVDLENGIRVTEQDLGNESPSVRKQAKNLLAKVYGGFSDGSSSGENGSKTSDALLNSGGVSLEKLEVVTEKLEAAKNLDSPEHKSMKEKRKKTSNKKAAKPPRPPRGPSLDAADQKLIREIAELAMLKRARVERMKAMKKMKAAKTSSSSGNVLAMVFTILFFLVITFQGISSRSTDVSFQGSPLSAEPKEAGLVSVQYYGNPSGSFPNGPESESPNLIEQIPGSDPQDDLRSMG